ncbi:hypothetical protein PSPO_b0319 [Pseudoalteromonas spongiae UST010723-006]|nr:hypothetical protein PSPO_b0319 [Pseudoalteromonas spongiae UST010723-006]
MCFWSHFDTPSYSIVNHKKFKCITLGKLTSNCDKALF